MPVSVQFYGIDAVVKAAENRKCPNWAIFQGRQFLFKCESENTEDSFNFLQQTLELIENSLAIYTIKFYESDGNKPIKIKENSACDGGSFNFRLTDSEQQYAAKHEGYVMSSTRGRQRIDLIEEKLDKLLLLYESEDLEPEDAIPEENRLQSALIGYIEQPSKINDLVTAVLSGIMNISSGMNMQQSIARVGQINQPGSVDQPGGAANLSPEYSDQNRQRLANALDTLGRNDPKIIEHLEKLASIAAGNPGRFNMLTNMLDGL